jgi:hypothetical protein
MTRDDIIRMAREAGFNIEQGFLLRVTGIDEDLARFAELVAAAERERLRWDGIHTCGPTCDNPACVAVREAVEAEREACCSIVYGQCGSDNVAQRTVDAIRARGSDEL